jgi:hypothetical protein
MATKFNKIFCFLLAVIFFLHSFSFNSTAMNNWRDTQIQPFERRRNQVKLLQLFQPKRSQIIPSTRQAQNLLKFEKNHSSKDRSILNKLRTRFPPSSLEVKSSLDLLQRSSALRAERIMEFQNSVLKNSLQPSIVRSSTLQRTRLRSSGIVGAGEFLELSPNLDQFVKNYTLEDVKNFVNFSIRNMNKIGSNPLDLHIENSNEQIDKLNKEYEENTLISHFNQMLGRSEDLRSPSDILEKQTKLVEQLRQAFDDKQIWDNLSKELDESVSFQESTKIFDSKSSRPRGKHIKKSTSNFRFNSK